jgi:hypothetical protein
VVAVAHVEIFTMARRNKTFFTAAPTFFLPGLDAELIRKGLWHFLLRNLGDNVISALGARAEGHARTQL